jgi:tRNA (guanine10-N2)-dimethyltransferase
MDDGTFGRIAERIALTRNAGRYLGSLDASVDGEIPEGTFAIRTRRFEGMMRDICSSDIVKKLGKMFSANNEVSLDGPDNEIRVLISDKVHVFLRGAEIDRTSFEERKVAERPFFSPVSLHPKYARAAINLSCVRRGDTVLDPFCGTGGITIEAASMGMRAIVSDIDGKMVDGCIENMEHYGLKVHDSDVLDIGDVHERFREIDAVVTDPPYGRSAHTAGEAAESIHARAVTSAEKCLKDGGRAVMVLPYELRTHTMAKEDVFTQKVHGSLTRHYHVLSKK